MQTLDDVEAAVAALECDPLTGEFDRELYDSREHQRDSEAADLSQWIRRRCWQSHARARADALAARCDRLAGVRLPRFEGLTSGGIWHPPVM